MFGHDEFICGNFEISAETEGRMLKIKLETKRKGVGAGSAWGRE